MKPIHYRMTVFEPENVFEPLVQFEAATPFMTIQHGDLVNPSLWPKVRDRADLKDRVLRVTTVEHGIEEADDHILHVVDVFTRAVENSEDVRKPSLIGLTNLL